MPLRLGQVDAAVEEGAAAERPGFRRPATRYASERPQHRGPHGEAPMQMQLGHVLAGGRGRARQPCDQGLIEDVAGVRVAQAAQGETARLRASAGQKVECRPRRRPADAHHRHRRTAEAARRGEDGVVAVG
ncbi:hypothetical protein M2440_005153 [Methylorubrum extorquens]|nr:hypothetical protein [Methylorubrum extorquens]